MIRTNRSQAGFEAVGVFLVILFIAIVGIAGFKLISKHRQATTLSSSSQYQVPARLQSRADLTKAGKSLDQSSVQLDAGLNDASLDSDLKSLL